MDETQETLRTSAFPSTHVKVNKTIFNYGMSRGRKMGGQVTGRNKFRSDRVGMGSTL